MKYTENMLEALRLEMKKRLSEKRFNHTLGVEKMAAVIGEKCLPDEVDTLRAAALLHDISKEYSEAEHFGLLEMHNLSMDSEEIDAKPLWHSVTAPLAVMREFPEYADERILSSVRNHTVGSPDMSVFDEIILLADYIEEGRTYENCVRLREDFLRELSDCKNQEESVLALHKAVVLSLENNINEFVSRGQSFHSKTKLTRDAILQIIERKSNGSN